MILRTLEAGRLNANGATTSAELLLAILRESDSAAGTATRSAMGASLSDSTKWLGGVLGPDGKIYGIPNSSTDILIIDPAAGTATRSAMGASLSDTYKWRGGVLGPDGKIYGIPFNSADILIIPFTVPIPGTLAASPFLNKF